MPNLPPISIPADAFEKADAKGADFYAELTDEERIEEGLPPRDPEKEAEKPELEPKVDEADEDAANDDGTNDEVEDEAYSQRLFDEIAGLREDLGASLGKSESAPKPKAEDPLLAAALEHEDEVVRGIAERLQQAEQRLEARENEARESRIVNQIAKDDAEFDAVQGAYLIDGKPMSDKQVATVENFILKNPDAGRSLSIEQLTRAVFPTAARRPRTPSANGPGVQNGNGSPVATIVETGSSGGAPSGGGAWKPRPNETIESAIADAGRRFGWKRD